MNTTSAPPFHQISEKRLGDRVMIPRFATDESRGYHYGTVVPGAISWRGVIVPGAEDDMIVEWDEPIPYLGKYSSTVVAIAVANAVWEAVDAWKDEQRKHAPLTQTIQHAK